MSLSLAPPTGLEPVTSWLTVMRSTDWAMEEYTIFFGFCQRFLLRLHKKQSSVLLKSPVVDLNNIFGCILKLSDSFRYISVHSHYRLSYGGIYSKTPFWVWCSLCWHLPIFPGRHQPSIFGTTELNFCVRYGNRWTLSVINTNYFTLIYIKTFQPYSLLVTRGGIEPPLSAWEAEVLTAWPTSHLCFTRGSFNH